MLRYLIILFFIFSSHSITCQTIGVLDSETKEPLAYAVCKFFLNDSLISANYSDKDGLIACSNFKFDSIEVSYLGYETYKGQINCKKNIFLKSQPFNLQEFQVLKNKNSDKIKFLGTIKGNSKLSAQIGSELVFYFKPIESDIGKSIVFLEFVCDKDNSNASLFRVHFYKPDNTRKPSVPISNKEKKFIIKGKGKTKIRVDISDFNIKINEEGLFIGVEWLGYENSKLNSSKSLHSFIMLNNYYPNRSSFFKDNFSNLDWVELGSFLNFPKTNGKFYNVSYRIGIE